MNEPLQVSVGLPDRVILKISGGLSEERLPALAAGITAGENMIKDLYAKTGRKIKVLLDMSEFDGTYDVKAMEGMIAFAKHNTEYVGKTAGFGGTSTGAAAGEIVAALADRENIQFFPTKEEAVTWLASR